jgi:hypothetical protein
VFRPGFAREDARKTRRFIVPDSSPTGWSSRIWLAVATTAAVGFGFLYLTRPSDAVGEAPYAQGDTVSPGASIWGTVRYAVPYLTPPNLKLTCAKRQYEVIAETELGFTWVAQITPEDLALHLPPPGSYEWLSGTTVEQRKKNLKPGLIFEEFRWAAKGLRVPPSTSPTLFEQKGTFYSDDQREGTEYFPVPYDSPPNVSLSHNGHIDRGVSIVECTEKSFKWKQVADYGSREVTWTAKGVRREGEGK